MLRMWIIGYCSNPLGYSVNRHGSWVAYHTSDPRPLTSAPHTAPQQWAECWSAIALIGDVNHSSGGRHLLSEPSVGKYFLPASPGSAAIALVSPNTLEHCDRWKNTERKRTMISVEMSMRVHWETRWEVLIKYECSAAYWRENG